MHSSKHASEEKLPFQKSHENLHTGWRHAMEIFSVFPVPCEGNRQVTGGFPSQRAGNTGFDVFFDVSPKQTVGWTVEMPVIWDAMLPIVTSL